MFSPSPSFFEALPLEQVRLLEPWQEDSDCKRLFGVELAKGLKPFEAALNVVEQNANRAMWVSHYWLTDPEVIAARDVYKKSLGDQKSLLDKDGLAVKLLKLADEKDPSGKFYLNEAKDRLAALKLYAEVQGYIGKIDINASTNVNNVNNKLELILVKAPNKEKLIEAESVSEPEIEVPKTPIELKLVKTA